MQLTLLSSRFAVQNVQRVISVQQLFQLISVRGTVLGARLIVEIHTRGLGRQVNGSARARAAFGRGGELLRHDGCDQHFVILFDIGDDAASSGRIG